MKKYIVSIFLVSFLFSSCDLLGNFKQNDSDFKVPIVWESGLYSNYYYSHIVDGDAVYFYERPPGYTTVNIYSLTRLHAETGELLWRSLEFSGIIFCPPVAIGGYIYVTLFPNILYCFDKETGEHTATLEINLDNREFEVHTNTTGIQQYIYLGLWTRERHFVRFDTTLISHHNDPDTVQIIDPEIIWVPEHNGHVIAKPVLYNNVVYASTHSPRGEEPVELAGFDIDTGEMVFHVTFGGSEDIDEKYEGVEKGGVTNPIFIYDDILYYLSGSISAWDIKTGNQFYRHRSAKGTPNHLRYSAHRSWQAVYYQGNIYYTSGNSDSHYGFHNIHCIEAETGKLVWNTVTKDSATLGTNVVIMQDRLYTPQYNGLWVFEPHTGELIGVDKSFVGVDMSSNVMYNGYMISLRRDSTGAGKLVAVNVGR